MSSAGGPAETENVHGLSLPGVWPPGAAAAWHYGDASPTNPWSARS